MEEDKKLTYVAKLIPFIRNIGYKPEPLMKIEENGIHCTGQFKKVDVEVAESGELSPEAQEEILNEEY